MADKQEQAKKHDQALDEINGAIKDALERSTRNAIGRGLISHEDGESLLKAAEGSSSGSHDHEANEGQVINPKLMAEIVRQIGVNNVKEDRVLAYITPAEAARLKKAGGLGTPDPVTGLPHFYDPDAKDPDHGDPGSAKEAKDRNDRAQAARDNAMNAMGADAASRSGIPANQSQEARDLRQQTAFSSEGSKALKEAALKAQQDAEDAYSWSFTGATFEPIGLGINVTRNLAARRTAGQKARDAVLAANNAEMTTSQRPGMTGENLGGDDVAKKMYPNTIFGSAKTPQTPVADFDYFTHLARKRQGYLSTILGGGPGAPTTGKSLLGQ